MAQKRIWLSWMPTGEGAPDPKEIITKLGRYGLMVTGADWADDLPRMAWAKVAEVLIEATKTDAWLLAGRREDLEKPSNRQALSLLTTMVSSTRGPAFPMVVLCLDAPLSTDGLPSLARGTEALSTQDTRWPAKVVAATARRPKPVELEFFLNVHAHPLVGQFVEVGPKQGDYWAGAMLGIHGDARISQHAVGPRGEVPERGIVEYELQGIKAEVSSREFVAWAVKNRLTVNDSYFLRIEGTPDALLVGNYPDEETDMMASVVDLS